MPANSSLICPDFNSTYYEASYGGPQQKFIIIAHRSFSSITTHIFHSPSLPDHLCWSTVWCQLSHQPRFYLLPSPHNYLQAHLANPPSWCHCSALVIVGFYSPPTVTSITRLILRTALSVYLACQACIGHGFAGFTTLVSRYAVFISHHQTIYVPSSNPVFLFPYLFHLFWYVYILCPCCCRAYLSLCITSTLIVFMADSFSVRGSVIVYW